ncbi:hypothetical protein A6A10_04305 [Otariodibacter oris]|uniref:HTH cro/C1-type domain-containing protein n=1 Tax=Otariodibacter oris TaxID=1032623 RepID=A0A420XJ48_9PAST|nr:hypothetical protein A6A10_04305 [Otariodibacter oris]RKR77158.1 hypothetical protein DES31_0483 [Otariodibacter oris]
MNGDFELGYTPANLRRLREERDLTQQEVADICEVRSWRSVARWECEIDQSDHADMTYTSWVKFLSYISSKDR